MTTPSRSRERRRQVSRTLWLGHCLTGASLLAGVAWARAGETNSLLTASQMFEGGKSNYNNWVEVSAGGFMISGSAAQAEQNHRLKRGAFGGIEDFHWQQNVATNTTFAIDGRALFDEHDYKVSLDLRREDLGYVRVNYENFRTWYNGAGGYFSPTGVQYQLPNDALSLDRGEVSFEAGLTVKNSPKVSFKYTHRYRDGEKSSTSWGVVHPDFMSRGLAPSFYDINEKVDIFQLDATHHIKATELGLGLRYETGDLNNALKITPSAGEDAQRKITDRQGTSYDALSVHAFSETWISKRLFFSSGFLFANLDNAFSGSRIYGSDFDVGYIPDALNGAGYYDLNGGSHKQEYVMNLNLMAIPSKNLSIVPSIRVQKEDWNADSSGIGTTSTSIAPFSAVSDRESLDVRERLDVRYSGLTNWVFYGSGEWTQGEGNIRENGGVSRPIQRETEDSRFFQKYSLGTRWYPARRVNIDVGGYYKDNRYDYEHRVDSTPNTPDSFDSYPAFLVMQGFETYDGNCRFTFRPLKNVSLVSRYEYQWSTIYTQPDPASGLEGADASRMTSHILAQTVSWTPWSRLALQAGFNYVLSKTKTPASDYTQAILDAQNNYWTLNFNANVVVDDKTDLNLGYFFYQADNFKDNSAAGVALGAGAEEHGVTATLTRRLTERWRLNLKYGYFHFDDVLSGKNNNYEAHVVFSSVQYRF